MIVAFSRFLRARVAALHPGFSPDIDPEVEIIDGRVRVFDQRGESCRLPS